MPEALSWWEQRLREIPGVRSVEVNRSTGSLLVQYDPEATRLPDEVPGFLHPSNDASVRPRVSPPSTVAQTVMRRFWHTDARLSEATEGRVDLKLAIPTFLLGAGLWELLTGAEVAGATFHVLAWYAYNVFYQLHPGEFRVATEPTVRPRKEV